jgi:putative heme-binding domain-containing protein
MVTNTPLQALVMLNDPQFVEAARKLGERIMKEGGATDDTRAKWAYRQVIGSQLTSEQLPLLLELITQQRGFFASKSSDADALLKVGGSPADPALDKTEAATFARLAQSDPSPVVRLYLATAIQRLSPEFAWPVIEGLASHAEDHDDHNIPKMIWFGLEPLVLGSIDSAVRLATSTDIPLLSRHVARRLAAAGQFEMLLKAIATTETGRREAMLLGLRDAIDGRSDMQPPPAWMEVRDQLVAAGGRPAELAIDLSQQFGDATALVALENVIDDPAATAARRGQAIATLAGRKAPMLGHRLVHLLDDTAVRREAIRAAAAYDDPAIAAELIDRYAAFSDDERREAVHSLAARSTHGRLLTEAIGSGRIPRQDVPAQLARQLQRIVGPTFVDVWGPVDLLPADKEAAYEKYRELLTDAAIEKGDLTNGQAVYSRVCASCHRLHGSGGEIGPELTGANRGNLEYLLGNILTPSAVIQDAYRMQVVLLDDGRVYSGIPAEENEHQLRLRVANQPEPVTISVAEIESREIASTSLMPEGLLANLSDAEVVDLIRYLQSQATPAAR